MTNKIQVERSLLRKVIAHVADNVHAFRQSESLPDGTLPNDEVREIVESEERMVEELRQALAEQPSEQGDVGLASQLRNLVETLMCSWDPAISDEDIAALGRAADVIATTPPQEAVAWNEAIDSCLPIGRAQEFRVNGQPPIDVDGETDFMLRRDVDAFVSKLRKLAPPANDEVLGFTGIARTKLDGLKRQGHELVGYLICKDGRYGTVDKWGRVIWLGTLDLDNGYSGVNANDEALRLLKSVLDLQRKRYGDGFGLHMDMIGKAGEIETFLTTHNAQEGKDNG